MKITALSILAGFATFVTSIRSLTLDERIDWGNSDPKGMNCTAKVRSELNQCFVDNF